MITEKEMFTIKPLNSKMKAGIAAFAAVILLIVVVSFSNTRNYYVKDTGFAVEIWQGTFSPLNSKMIISLPGAHAPEAIKDIYNKADALILAFNYYTAKADALSRIEGIPDFQAVKSNLMKAWKVATNKEQRDVIYGKLALIDTTIQSFKDAVEGKKAPAEEKKAPKETPKAEPKKTTDAGHAKPAAAHH